MIGKHNRFSVNIDELRHFNPKLANFVLKHPVDAIKIFEDQLNNTVKGLSEDDNSKLNNEKMQVQNTSDMHFPKKVATYYINFEGNFGQNHVTPRGLKANLVNQFVAVQGIVTKMSIVRPTIQTSVHYCEATKRGMIKKYND
jgi:DNA replication licensing factor MCM3